jgi:hypothetical protein
LSKLDIRYPKEEDGKERRPERESFLDYNRRNIVDKSATTNSKGKLDVKKLLVLF